MVSKRRSRHARRKGYRDIYPYGRCSEVAGFQVLGMAVDCSLPDGHAGAHCSSDHGVNWERGLGTDTISITGQQLGIRAHVGTGTWIDASTWDLTAERKRWAWELMGKTLLPEGPIERMYREGVRQRLSPAYLAKLGSGA